MLSQFKATLDDKWPSSDKAKSQRISPSKSVVWAGFSGSKRSRSVAKEADGLQ
jgi:hypothetical protein